MPSPKPVQKEAPKAVPKKRDLAADRLLFKAGIDAFVANRRKQRKDNNAAVAARLTELKSAAVGGKTNA